MPDRLVETRPTSLLRAFVHLLATFFIWAFENAFVPYRRRDVPCYISDHAGIIQDVKRLLKKVKDSKHRKSKRFLRQMCKRMNRIDCHIVAFSIVVLDPQPIATLLNADAKFALESLDRVKPSEKNGNAAVISTDIFCVSELQNVLTGVLTGMNAGQPTDQDHWHYTRKYFDIRVKLVPKKSREIFAESGELFNVPNLCNDAHDCSVNVAVRLLASLGRQFFDMAQASLAGANRTRRPNVDKIAVLTELLKLLDNTNGYDEKNPRHLRRAVLPNVPANSDLDICVVLFELLKCLNRPSLDRFTSYVDRVRVCPRPGCVPYPTANYPTLTLNNTSSVVSIYVWANPDMDYTERHDEYQKRTADFSEPVSQKFACSFRHLGNSRRVDRMGHCSKTGCTVNADQPCFVKERLTSAKHVGNLTRWQIIYCKVDVNPALPNDHKDNLAQFKRLHVTPYPTLDLHGYHEKPTLGSAVGRSERPEWITADVRRYKLVGYILLSSKRYDHVIWRTSYTVNDTPYYLHCDDKYTYEIDEEDYLREGQKILLMVYETLPAAQQPSSSSKRRPEPARQKAAPSGPIQFE